MFFAPAQIAADFATWLPAQPGEEDRGWTRRVHAATRDGASDQHAQRPVARDLGRHETVGDDDRRAPDGARIATPKPELCPNWQVFTGANGGNTTTLNSDSYGVAMNLTFGAVLEAYQVGVCNHYPPDQGIAFTNVTIRDANGANVAPGWTTDRHPVSPSCNANGTGTGATTNLTWCIPADASGIACTGYCGETIDDGCGGTIRCPACPACPNGYKTCPDGSCVVRGALCP